MALQAYMKKKLSLMQEANPKFDMEQYFDLKDEEELASWHPRTKKIITNKLIKMLTNKIDIIGKVPVCTDAAYCPWCIRFYDDKTKCKKCQYGKRHGYCNDRNSSYFKYRVLGPRIFSLLIKYDKELVLELQKEEVESESQSCIRKEKA